MFVYNEEKAIEDFISFIEKNDINENKELILYEYFQHKNNDLGDLIKSILEENSIEIRNINIPENPLNFGIIEVPEYYSKTPLNNIIDLYNILGKKLGFEYNEDLDIYWVVYTLLLDIFEFDNTYIDKFFNYLTINNYSCYKPPFNYLIAGVFHLIDINIMINFLESELNNLYGKVEY